MWKGPVKPQAPHHVAAPSPSPDRSCTWRSLITQGGCYPMAETCLRRSCSPTQLRTSASGAPLAASRADTGPPAHQHGVSEHFLARKALAWDPPLLPRWVHEDQKQNWRSVCVITPEGTKQRKDRVVLDPHWELHN